MSNNFRHLYITTPLFYPSDKLHLGHAFTLLMADVLKKYYQLLNFDVFLLTGSDEHGEKILKKSIEQKIQPIELVDKNVDYFKRMCVSLKIDYDSFVRTSNDKHKLFVQKSFSDLLKSQKIYPKHWTGHYCISCEENYSANYKACKLGHDLNTKNEESFFFKLNDSVDLLKYFYSKKKPDISPSWHIQELNNSFLVDLEDLSITRKNLQWGVQTLEHPNFTVYVWFDALLGYISGDSKDLWDREDTKIVHIIGKDILRFHGIYWPLILSFLGKRSPNKIITHGWILCDDKKMSKSIGNVVDVNDLLNTFGLDSMRFFLINLHWELDNQLKTEDIYGSHNTYLANLYGNLISRFYGLLKKNNLLVPKVSEIKKEPQLDQLVMSLENLINSFTSHILNDDIPQLIQNLFALIRTANKTVDSLKPWSLEVSDEIYKSLMVALYKTICFSTLALSPILIDAIPNIAQKISLDLGKFNIEMFKGWSSFNNRQLISFEDPAIFKRLEKS